MNETLNNWAQSYTYRATHIHQPETVEQIQELVIRTSKLKALGTRHSFNDIADSPGDLVSLERLDNIVALDRERLTVTVEAGSVMESLHAGSTRKGMPFITWHRCRISR
ncbi:MAG TPA: FAD-binding protein [Anaerolineales bacterium]|nr:FAD-binding protein [Anaerolineales bacterium]